MKLIVGNFILKIYTFLMCENFPNTESPQTSIHGYRPLIVASVRPGSAAQRLVSRNFCGPTNNSFENDRRGVIFYI